MYYYNFTHLGGSNSKERGRMSGNASERIQRHSVFEGERENLHGDSDQKSIGSSKEMIGVGKFYPR